MTKKHNFSAGPSILPESVFEKASEAVLNFNGLGLSILEISHRSPEFVEVMNTARNLVLELLNLENKGYQVLFLHGGASMQFPMTAQNLLETKAAFLTTGRWSENALKEAKNFGKTVEVASSKDKNYSYIPENYPIPEDADYFHCTSNNTIYGTQIRDFPETEVPVVCDMSSDIFSRQLDFSKFSLIYAGVQKNIGPASLALVVVKESILGRVSRKIPSIFDYQLLIERESMFNTPPVFSVYVSMLTLQWLKDLGGIPAIEKKNTEKAGILYRELDRNSAFKPRISRKKDRSAMNITFDLTHPELGPRFEKLLKEAGISGLQGHRTAGGYRASLYNAMPLDSVKILIETMQYLEKKS